ncbi:hypothetical protein F3Y22_tig00110962pilonHSYRG00027 [Hibiscus syriacus]|uniref:RNase H type-1 domain-containing protein n=1 Tax=Hibiscus syriacus TaxID=106335 RepID=A0A6A2ZC39_HIBSY|nr:hypothetical protein F3Y22_tig00110962pilonHSYRG00027 [Hibiscus syriacus]
MDGAANQSTMEVIRDGVLRDSEGTWLSGYYRSIGQCSKHHRVDVEMNSHEVIKIFSSSDPSSEPVLVRRIHNLLQRHWSVRITYINRVADTLANLGQKASTTLSGLNNPPNEIHRALQMDINI